MSRIKAAALWTKSPWTCNKEESEAVKKCVKLYFAFKEVVLVKKEKKKKSPVCSTLVRMAKTSWPLSAAAALSVERKWCLCLLVCFHPQRTGDQGKISGGESCLTRLLGLIFLVSTLFSPVILRTESWASFNLQRQLQWLDKASVQVFQTLVHFRKAPCISKALLTRNGKICCCFFILFSFTNKNHLYLHYVQVLKYWSMFTVVKTTTTT